MTYGYPGVTDPAIIKATTAWTAHPRDEQLRALIAIHGDIDIDIDIDIDGLDDELYDAEQWAAPAAGRRLSEVGGRA